MKKFSIPVTWSVQDKIEVEAETIEDAVKYVKEHIDEIPLGTEPEYIEDSYRIDDGNDGENDIEGTIKYLKECWNLSGGIDDEEIDDIEVQTKLQSFFKTSDNITKQKNENSYLC